MSVANHRMQENVERSEAVVEKSWFSSVSTLCVRECYSLELQKVIYERLGYPSHGRGLEKAFMEFLDRDACVERFLKVSESQTLLPACTTCGKRTACWPPIIRISWYAPTPIFILWKPRPTDG